jgi:epoxyqueuosine reductase
MHNITSNIIIAGYNIGGQVMNEASEKLFCRLEEHGFKGKVVPVKRLNDLRDEIKSRHLEGQLNDDFYQEWLTFFDFTPPGFLPGAASIVIIAAPQPQVHLSFTLDGEVFSFLVPPTYFHDIDKEIKDVTEDSLSVFGYSVVEAKLPKKLLAVRSGLANYGKNNITYVEGMGSFYRLQAFFSDLPCDGDNWREHCVMDDCKNCSACAKSCLTGAITEDHFLIRAEKCLTYHNESKKQFPGWIDFSWHHCIVGCMKCQTVCPRNKKFTNRVVERGGFSEEETRFLLRGTVKERFPAGLQAKLKKFYLLEYQDVLHRNLQVLFDNYRQL